MFMPSATRFDQRQQHRLTEPLKACQWQGCCWEMTAVYDTDHSCNPQICPSSSSSSCLPPPSHVIFHVCSKLLPLSFSHSGTGGWGFWNITSDCLTLAFCFTTAWQPFFFFLLTGLLHVPVRAKPEGNWSSYSHLDLEVWEFENRFFWGQLG